MAEFAKGVQEHVGAAIRALIHNNPAATVEEVGQVAITALEGVIHPTSTIRILPFLENYEAVALIGSRKPGSEGVSRFIQMAPDGETLWSCPNATRIRYQQDAQGQRSYVNGVDVREVVPPTGMSADAPVQGAPVVPPFVAPDLMKGVADHIKRNQG